MATEALTDGDRQLISMARELAALNTSAAMAAHTGSDPADILGAYAAAFGDAKVLLRMMADLAERLAGESAATEGSGDG